MPQISLIITYYNKSNFIKNLLNRITFNPVIDYEIILINDGSSKNSTNSLLEIISKEQFSNIIYYETKNRGVSAAKNYGLSKASGEYIWFLDGDDYIVENWSEKITEIIQISNSSDVIAIDFMRFKDGKEETVPWLTNFCLNGHYEYETYIDSWYNIGNNYQYIFKRNLLIKNNIKFKEKLNIAEDAIFNVDAFLKANDIFAYRIPLYIQNQNIGSSLSRPQTNKMLKKVDDDFYAHTIIKNKICLNYAANFVFVCEFTFYRLFWLEKIKENKLIDFNKNSIKKNILYIYQEYLKDQRWIYMGNYIEKIYNFKLRELSIFEQNFEKLIKLL